MMDTLTIRVYTNDGGYNSSREIKINIEELREWIEENKLKPIEVLESISLESVS